ncbi:MAG: hypothetical protein RIQ78_968 [Bacteroidota bacterium]|jgi:hypothetical protein
MRRSTFFSLKYGLALISFLVFTMLSAQSPKLGVQGILKKANGNAVDDGTYTITFKIYNTETGGAALWTEVQSEVDVSSGIYSAVLGSVTELNLSFNEGYYLGVKVGSTPEMAPRMELTTASYALSLKGSSNLFPSTGAVGAGTNAPTAGYQLHIKNGAGIATQMVEGSTGAQIDVKKSTNTATIGFGTADNVFKFNAGTNNTVIQYNGSDRLGVNTNGMSVTGSGTLNGNLTVSSGTAALNNVSFSGSTINNSNNTEFRYNGNTRLAITTEGAFVTGYVDISGSKSYSGSYGYFANDGNIVCTAVGGSSGTNNYTISCDSRMRASEYNSYSDRRIKKDFVLSDGFHDMEVFKRLRVTNYRYIDAVQYGSALKKGFIAQEVESVFPEAVAITRDFVPNIYEKASDVSLVGDKLTLALSHQHGLKVGDLVRLFLADVKEEKTVVTVTDANTFTVSDWRGTKPEVVFVYGKQVDDFHQVDYDRIHTLNVSVTQELARSLDAQGEDNTALKNDSSALKRKVDALDARVRTLEATIAH